MTVSAKPGGHNETCIMINDNYNVVTQRDLCIVGRFTIIVYPMHWIDPLISFFRLSVCVSLNSEQIGCPQFFTDFYEILHAAKQCGRIDAYRLCHL